MTVVVQEEDYKAVVYVALDRSDRSYYACDAGCLDQLVELRFVALSCPYLGLVIFLILSHCDGLSRVSGQVIGCP